MTEANRRELLWQFSFKTYYECFLEAIVADKLVQRWQWFDRVATTTVAMTASGSAISGWALWNEAAFRPYWAVLAGLGAVLSILHSNLGVANQLKTWRDLKSTFTLVRIELETFRFRMLFQTDRPVDEHDREFQELRKRFAEGFSRIDNDIWRTRGLIRQSQDLLDSRLREFLVS